MRTAFICTAFDLFESTILPDKLAKYLKKENYESCVIIDSHLGAAYDFYASLSAKGISVIPGLKSDGKYYMPLNETGFFQLIKFSNNLDTKLTDVQVIDGPPRNLDLNSKNPIWEVRYLEKKDKEFFDNYRKIGKKPLLKGDYHLLSAGEYDSLFDEKLKLPEFEFPKYAHKFPVSLSEREFKKNAFDRLPDLGYTEKAYKDRLEYELGVVSSKGLESYFATVAEVVDTADKIGCWVGPGRGSAVSSLLVRVLGITAVDPVENGLFFERFLSAARDDFPDIDLDVEDEMRQELIKALKKRFGKRNLSLIQTYGTFSFRSAIRAAGKLFDLSETQIKRLIALSQKGKSLPQSLARDTNIKKTFKLSKLLIGLPSTESIHAAGVLLSAEPLDEIIPIRESGGTYISRWNMNSLETLGFQKLDLLGLRNLSILKKLYAKKPWYSKPDDSQTYDLIGKGYTAGLFQLESIEATRIVKRVKPRNISDIAISLALNRPGPLESGITAKYLKERAVPSQNAFSKALTDTLGVLVFQEQVISVAVKELGLTPEEGEMLRRALSKKKPEEAEKLIAKSLKRSTDNPESTNELIEILRKFSGYGFNKSHSVAYSLITYWLAFKKCHEPERFFKVLFSLLDAEGKARLAAEMKSRGLAFSIGENPDKRIISLCPSDLMKFRLELPLEPTAASFHEFVRKRRDSLMAKDLEFLIKIGYFDKYGTRETLLKEINNALSGVDPELKSVLRVFGYKERQTENTKEELPEEKAVFEHEALGFNLTEFHADLLYGDFVDSSLTDLYATKSNGLAAYSLMNFREKRFITDGKSLIRVQRALPEKGFIIFKSGKPDEKQAYENIELVIRRYNQPVPAEKLFPASKQNVLKIRLGGKNILTIEGAKVEDYEPDEIEVIEG
ncbi:hypothetical protein AT15_09435 [Kosmotoga arenicorallina S304]|uniref:Uncharacterized protein n=1 Tax=Kosmotoga arenicorallina S304 TaxID=1453497 RepID=A0A176K1E0_9BACT|nr:hypothetical protein [Kosmotoga arenicorallina]OAA30895.1 hypothetical protein AT15_09435 [Kosmotoga arenicorallina S304]